MASGGLIVLEQVPISYMDLWIPLTSMEVVVLDRWLFSNRGVLQDHPGRHYLIAKAAALAGGLRPGALPWSLVALSLALALLGLTRSATICSSAVSRWMEIVQDVPSAADLRQGHRLLHRAATIPGCRKFCGRPGGRIGDRPGQLSTIQSLVLRFAAFLAIKLSIDGVIIPVVSAIRHSFRRSGSFPTKWLHTGHRWAGNGIVSEALALAQLYALAWPAFVGRTATKTHDNSDGVGQQGS